MSKSADLGLPIVESIDGQEVSFPRFEMDELDKWGEQILSKRKAAARLRVAGNKELSAFDRERIAHLIENEEVEYGHIVARSYTTKGIRKVLLDSLVKSGRSPDDALAILKKIHHQRQADLAREIMSPPTPELAEMQKAMAQDAPADPNARAGETAGGTAAVPDATSLSNELA